MEEKSPKAGLSPDWQRGRTLNPSDTKKNDTRIVTIVGMRSFYLIISER